MLTAGSITLVLKLIISLALIFSMRLRFRQIFDAESEIHLHLSLFRNRDLPHLARQALMPGFKLVGAGGHIENCIPAFFICGGEIWILQNKHNAAHPRMDRTEHINSPWLVKFDAADFRILIETQIEGFGFRKRKSSLVCCADLDPELRDR